MSVSEILWRGLFHAACVIGRPIGGIRPRRLYDALGRRAYPRPSWRWVRNDWGHRLYLSPHYHIDRNIIAFGTYDRPLHRAMEYLIHPGMTCLDVGANLGEMALHMARLAGPTGQVLAFEPVPHVFARLAAHAEQNPCNLRCLPLALGDQDGQAEIACPGEACDNQGLGSLVAGPCALPQRITVQTARLDSLLQREGLRSVDFIKLDIEGAEPLFLSGAEQTLRRFHPVLAMEVSPEPLQRLGLTSRSLVERIVDLGYRIFELGSLGPGRQIAPDKVAPGFSATNVICMK